MTSLFIGLYGLFLLLVGARGNAGALLDLLGEDVGGYIPWLFSIIAISVLSENETTEKLVKPFVALLALNFLLFNFGTIQKEIGKIYAQSRT